MNKNYVPLYRKYRPQTIEQIVGQEHIKKALANAIKMDRISHAYLFTGPRGTGKTSTARIFAKSLNCVNGPTITPCNECENCKNITNSLQTNGLLIDDDWCKFLKENNFLVGLSLDGNKDIHNKYRKDIFGNGTFDRVFNSLKLLQDYNIDFNVLASVSRYSSKYPLEIYNFFKENKIKYIQFSPIVERLPDEEAKKLSLTHSIPNSNSNEKVTDYSVEPESYGDFLISIFDEWVKKDVGEIFVMNFEWALTSWLGLDSTICLFRKECSGCTVVEHNGDIYSCDHYVYPDYKIGNIINDNPRSIIDSDKQKSFGLKKSNLPKNCLRCDALFACRGECPKNRFDKFYDGEEGKNYLCEGYKKYFYHIHPYMKAMRELLENNIDIR